MIPIRDDSRTFRRPYVTYGLIGLCFIAFAWQVTQHIGGTNFAAHQFGMIPYLVLGGDWPYREIEPIAPAASLLSYMFIHGSWLHLLSNMLYLWIFAKAVEDRLGHGGFIALYIASGIAAAIAQILPDARSLVPMIGASGAVSGILGAYLIMFPHARVQIFVPISIMIIHHVRARILLIVWFVFQLVLALSNIGVHSGVAWWAHIGGFLFGAGIAALGRNVLGVRRLRPNPWD